MKINKTTYTLLGFLAFGMLLSPVAAQVQKRNKSFCRKAAKRAFWTSSYSTLFVTRQTLDLTQQIIGGTNGCLSHLADVDFKASRTKQRKLNRAVEVAGILLVKISAGVGLCFGYSTEKILSFTTRQVKKLEQGAYNRFKKEWSRSANQEDTVTNEEFGTDGVLV